MPPPVLHMSLAKMLADSLALSDIDSDRGAYYLGSTAPDIRAITRWDRDLTHFFDLNDFGHQDSVGALFDAHPELAKRAGVAAGTAAFLAGYITHLVLDEGWISDVYRPLFGEKSPLAGSERANVMDRVIQFEMDRQKREDRPAIDAMRADIAATALEIAIGFIDIETLRRWREVNLDFLTAPPTWERFRNVASRHLRAYGVDEPAELERFMTGVPALLLETIDHVGWQRVQAYLDESLTNATRAGEGLPLVRIVVGAEEARRTILRRRRATEAEPSPAARKRTAEVMGAEMSAQEAVRRIIRDVINEGDAAVRRYNEGFDGVSCPDIEVPQAEIERALAEIEPDLRAALEFAAGRIKRYHEGQASRLMTSYQEDGLGVRVRALEIVGFYVPGIAPVYPSSVLHTLIPARVAGVSTLVMVSGVDRGGHVPAVKLAAAAIAGADRVFAASGAQAVAALAYGTQTIPRVDKICGPGNIFVTLAKREVFGDVGIDSIYGPTETVVVADADADPVLCAVDMIAQAEHDEMATPLLITSSLELARRVVIEVEARLATLPRGSIARAAIEGQGGAVVAASIEEAVELASEFAPEHLCLLSKDARRLSSLVKNAGGIFIGESSPEAIGDYTGGPSHVMPTGGAARFASPLSVLDFLKFSTVMEIRDEDIMRLGPAGARIAYAEGLEGHARAIEERLPK